MPYLKMPNVTPPGGWRYFQPETRLWFSGDDQGFEDMLEKIASHRSFRKLARTSLIEVKEDVHKQMCERLGPEHCRDFPDGAFYLRQNYAANMSLSTVLAGSKAIMDFLIHGVDQVPLEQVKQRAGVCLSCHLNTPMTGCGTCSSLGKTIAKILPGERQSSQLNACAACGCSLQLKVNATIETIKNADDGRDIQYPDHCWVKKELNALG
jgi:hypothetical protein